MLLTYGISVWKTKTNNIESLQQFLGTWYELEHSFYLPEIISSCTQLTFKDGAEDVGLDDNELDITVRSTNQW